MRYNKKGQAAMEFLMTYGWAILIAIIAIAALIAFGVLNPGKASTNTCGTGNALTTNLGCKELKAVENAGATDGLNVVLSNGLGANLDGVNVTMATTGDTGYCSIALGTGATTIVDGSSQTYTWTTCNCVNGRLKSTISVAYILAGETLPHTVSGPINVRCEAA